MQRPNLQQVQQDDTQATHVAPTCETTAALIAGGSPSTAESNPEQKDVWADLKDMLKHLHRKVPKPR